MDSFTYVISSINAVRTEILPATIPKTYDPLTANNCNIELAGLPNYRKFKCEVIDFVIDVETIDVASIVGTYLSLVVSGEMQILDGVMHPKKFDRICNINLVQGTMTGLYGNVFTVENFNKHTVNFQLLLPNMLRVSTAHINQTNPTYWTLTLKIIPIIE